MDAPPILVCFAVKQEAGTVRSKKNDAWRTIITGMGQKNAERDIRRELEIFQPKLVITAGFAGGLNPALKDWTVVFDEDDGADLSSKLLKARAVPVRFHCANRVAVTVEEKKALWQSTGADAVEMESGIIRAVCREHNIPSATIRVISDAADRTLPLDFNALMTADYKMNYAKLAGALIRSPGKISELNMFRVNLGFAQRNLELTLLKLLMEP